MIRGDLFSKEFLVDGIREFPEWNQLKAETIAEFKTALIAIFSKFPISKSPNEATTERDLIEPILKQLSWVDYLPQQTAAKKGRSDVPDFLLFANNEDKDKANKENEESSRYRHGLSILEAKAWDISLDRGIGKGKSQGSVPSHQILRYMSRVEILSEKKIKWGFLTNGRFWRIYYQDAKSRSEEFLEMDLKVILGLEGAGPELFNQEDLYNQDWLKVFYILFGKEYFLKRDVDRKSFHDRVVETAKYWEEQVSKGLSDVVFNIVFPLLAEGFYLGSKKRNSSPKPNLQEVRDGTLTILYRLLFVFYAEDRSLLPVNDTRYVNYGLRQNIRQDIADRKDRQDTFSETQTNYYQRLKNLFRAIDKGDASIGLPPYNGGLFDNLQNSLIEEVELSDHLMADVIDNLSRHEENGQKKWINYRDLSVQHLGSIYERLLAFELVLNKGKVEVRPSIFSRKTSGGYYTPEVLVRLILSKTIGPILEEKKQKFLLKAQELGKIKSNKQNNIKELEELDPAENILKLRFCDPAMGSGHFLVSLVDFLADCILEATVEAQNVVEEELEGLNYVSPLLKEISDIQIKISEKGKRQHWTIFTSQLDDRHIIRRMILKRCVYGIDKNPMAVELAKVSLWLHTFTVGAPLSFLDHHLKCGDSLFGEFTFELEDYLRSRGSLVIDEAVKIAKEAAQEIKNIEEISDIDLIEIKNSEEKFNAIRKRVDPINKFYSFVHAGRWMVRENSENKIHFNSILDGQYGDPIDVAISKDLPKTIKEPEAIQFWNSARKLANEERFFNWEIAYPRVWDKWEDKLPVGGFDAVIGNPPWDRMKFQQVEWFETRNLEIAKATRASEREKLIEKLKKNKDPLWNDFVLADTRTKVAVDVARNEGQYPLLSGGDVNIYSLFVERSHRLVKNDGIVGLVIPSGIAGDKGSSEFFKSLSTSGRLSALFDFENKKVFFPDIHASFKFLCYVAGGKDRKFENTSCAYFLHDIDEINDPERCFNLTAEDFSRVNPNTGTAPIFKSKRAAMLTKDIYKRNGILNDHKTGSAWPIKYFNMFHMTNDSNLFKTREELEKDNFYLVDEGKMKKGKSEYLPLYEGKMVQAYDHRAAGIKVNSENVNRPAQPVSTSFANHSDPEYFPTPQFWVEDKEVDSRLAVNEKDKPGWYLSFKDVTASTNIRSMISSFIPRRAVGNTLPLILFSENRNELGPLLLANFNSLPFDFLCRQKIQGQHLNWYIVEQVPVISPTRFDEVIGKNKIGDLIRKCVLELTYTSNDMKKFAEDMGLMQGPFSWDEEKRRHLKARIDALFFMLYGLEDDDVKFVMEDFSIIKKEDTEQFSGKFVTRDLVLGYMRAYKAGDVDTKLSLK